MKRVKNLRIKLVFTAVYFLLVAILFMGGVPCFFKATFGVLCPGCGMTRAVVSACRLDFITAFRYHPMFWSMPLVYLYILFDGRLFNKRVVDVTVLSVIAFGFLVWWILRLTAM